MPSPPSENDSEDREPLPVVVDVAPHQIILQINPADDPDQPHNPTYVCTSDNESYRAILELSEREYKFENERRYHAFHAGAYVLPNDEQEQDRMDFLHHIYLMLLDGELYKAPLPKDIRRVLDLGTGTGIWPMEFAEKFPSAKVIGNDLSPIQPTWVPPNCMFEIKDFEDDWSFTEKFDYIHARELQGCISDCDKLCRRAFEHLNSGGYFEFQANDAQTHCNDGTLEGATRWNSWLASLHQVYDGFGKSLTIAETFRNRMIRAGFEDVREFVYKIPLSPWSEDVELEELGRYEQVQQLQALDAYTLALFTRTLGKSKTEIDEMLDGVRENLRDRSIHSYFCMYFVYGTKP